MSKTYSKSDTIAAIANSLIPSHHPELATARIDYLFMSSTPKKGGRELFGKASKVSGKWEFLVELDFLIEVSEPAWAELSEDQRRALVDHLLEGCTGEEDESSGEMKWGIREPDVQEFSTILQRHGVWNEALTGFVQVAQQIDLSAIIEEETGEVEENELNLNDMTEV